MADNAANEPSMEEILASIRKIISEDGATVQAAEPAEGILDLTEEVATTEFTPQTAATLVDPIIELEDAAPPAPPTHPEITFESVETTRIDTGDNLISDNTTAASISALGGLASMMRSQSAAHVSSLPLGNGGITLEGMVLEILRPQLKTWLDQNLPTLVEKIVQKEIQKITRDLR